MKEKLITAYREADALEQKGELMEAYNAFHVLIPYEDCEERARSLMIRTREQSYALAKEYEEAGDYVKARELYLMLGDYEDCAERAINLQAPADYQTAVQDNEKRPAHLPIVPVSTEKPGGLSHRAGFVIR